jgi:hypothetical protein
LEKFIILAIINFLDMSKEQMKGMSRRAFLGTSALGLASLTLLPACNTSGSGRKIVKLGFIGLGQQSMFLLSSFLQIEGVDVLAGCDVYGIKRQRFELRVNEFNKKAGKTRICLHVRTLMQW